MSSNDNYGIVIFNDTPTLILAVVSESTFSINSWMSHTDVGTPP